MISKPRLHTDHPDRHIECQEALQLGLQNMIRSARERGWALSEIEMALMDLVIAQIKATEANLDVDVAVRLAAQRVGSHT